MFYGRNSIKSVNEVNYDVEARDGYVGEAGAIQIMIEAEQNNYKLFEAMVANDFDELAFAHGHLNESALEAINEASGSGFLAKVKQWLINLWEKIKGIFKSFWTTLQSVVIRDNEKLVKALKPKIVKQTKLDKLEVTFAKQKVGFEEAMRKLGDLDSSIGVSNLQSKFSEYNKSGEKDTSKLDSIYTEESSTEAIDKIYADTFKNNATSTDYIVPFHEYLFEKEEKQKVTDADITAAEGLLLKSSKQIKAIKDLETKVNKTIKEQVTAIDKFENSIKLNGNTMTHTDFEGKSNNFTGTENTRKVYTKIAAIIRNRVTLFGTVQNKFVSCMLSEYKYAVKQARRVYVGAARFNPTMVKEDALIVEGYNDVVDFEVDTMFEAGAWA